MVWPWERSRRGAVASGLRAHALEGRGDSGGKGSSHAPPQTRVPILLKDGNGGFLPCKMFPIPRVTPRVNLCTLVPASASPPQLLHPPPQIHPAPLGAPSQKPAPTTRTSARF